jgi:hypothetical protein
MIEIILSTYNPERGWYIRRKVGDPKWAEFLHKDFTWYGITGWTGDCEYTGSAPGYYPTQAIAQAYLDEYLSRNQIKGEQKMNKYGKNRVFELSNGVEISEDTVINALKKAGISVEPPKPYYVFKAGDVAYYGSDRVSSNWRFIVKIKDDLYGINQCGVSCSIGQSDFEECNYRYAGRLANLLK